MPGRSLSLGWTRGAQHEGVQTARVIAKVGWHHMNFAAMSVEDLTPMSS